MDDKDVKVVYYPTTCKNHEVACIFFKDDLELCFSFERVMLRFEGDRLYFEEAQPGHGLHLANSKIQVWAIANKLKNWEGYFPLRFDIQTGRYFLEFSDKIELEKDKKEGLKLGSSVQYTKHYGVNTSKKQSPKEVAEEQTEVVAPKKEQKPSKNNIASVVLLDRLVESIDTGNYDDARELAIAIRTVLSQQ